MKVSQVYEILNTMTEEYLGDSVVVSEDLSNVVDVGKAFDALDGAVENYIKKLPDVIGKMVIVNRMYETVLPDIVRDGWDFGSILSKVSFEIPEAAENESWQLQKGASYDPNVFNPPEAHVKFFNDRVTFSIPISITRMQAMSAFNSAEQLNAFYSGIETMISNAMAIYTEQLERRGVNNFIAETVFDDYGSALLSSKSGVKAINLLYLYNQTVTTPITVADCLYDPDFLRFASYQILLGSDRIRSMSRIFNIEGRARFTPFSEQRVIMLSDFARAAGVYLYDANGQFLTENLKLPEASTIPFWQGNGTDFDFDEISKIDVKTGSGDDVEVTGVIAFIYDRDAIAVTNENPRTTTYYNPVGEFANEWHKWDAGVLNSFDEQALVYFVA